MNLKELNEIKENSFDIWFERWWKKSNLIERLKQAAMQGYSGYSISLEKDEYINRRMRDERFIAKLKDLLPDLDIEYQTESKEYKTILGTRRETSEKITISWEKGVL